MEDIAILTVASSSAKTSGIKLENVPLDELGRAKKIVVDKKTPQS